MNKPNRYEVRQRSHQVSSILLVRIKQYFGWFERLDISLKFEFVSAFNGFAETHGHAYRFDGHTWREVLAWCIFKFADQPIKIRDDPSRR
jgi:hypothetical protein